MFLAELFEGGVCVLYCTSLCLGIVAPIQILFLKFCF